MNDFNSSASVRRLATALNRRFGVWVASPSVALLSALVAGKGRPKRLLVELGVPPFVSNIARIAGATPVHVPASQVRPAIRGAVVTEGLSPDLVWVTAVHREGHLAETEWLTEARSHGVPSVEICLGSLGALMTVPERLASFTIVQLDAERTLDGLQLTALLTDDSDLADRVRQLCLPGPGSADYVLDASPRGVTHDEPALLSLLDALIARAQSPAVEEPLPPAAGQGFDLSWSRRFQDEDGPVSAVVAAPPPSRDEPGKNPWLMRFAEAEARQAQAVQSLTALRSQFESEQAGRARVNERLQLIEKESAERGERLLILQAERDRLKVAALAQAEESDKNLMRAQTQIEELETNAIFNSKERAELLEQKNEVARQLSAAEKERATLSARAEALERDQAKVEAAREKLAAQLTRAEAEIQAMTLKAEASERDRKELKKEATSHNERAVAAEAARMALATQIARFESEVGTNDQSRNHLLDQKAVVEGELALARAEAGALKSKIEGVEARQKQHEAEASRREIALDSTLTEQKSLGAQFEKDIAAAHERATIAEASRSEVMAQVARLQADLASKDSGRSELLGQKTALDRDLALSQAEIKTLRSRLERLESERTEAKADASRGEAALRTALDDEKKRAQRFEKDAAALAERATSWETSRAELNARVAQLERDLARDAKAQAEGADRKATLDKQLTIVSAANADLTGRLAGAHAAQRAQEARLKELETSLSSAASERRVGDQRMAKADETHRLALEAAEIRLAEARLTAQTTATQSAENWKSRLDSAEQTTLALKTALDARASEAAAYEKAHVASHAHRQALEERISQLKRLAQAEARGDAKARSTNDSMEKTSIKEPRPKPEPEIAEPETAREKAVWELPRPRFAPSDDSDADFGASLSLGGPIDYSAPDDLPSLGASPRDKQDEEKHRSQREVFLDVSQPDFTPEYEHGIKPEEKRGKSAKGWLAGVASRIRRG